MKTKKPTLTSSAPLPSRKDFFENAWDESWVYSKTVVDVTSKSVLILNKDYRVIEANESFYRNLQTTKEATQGKSIYELSDRQWDTAEVHRLLEKVLDKPTFFGGFEVPATNNKIFMLHARQIYIGKRLEQSDTTPIILVALEDISEMIALAESFAEQLIKR